MFRQKRIDHTFRHENGRNFPERTLTVSASIRDKGAVAYRRAQKPDLVTVIQISPSSVSEDV